MPLLLKAGRKGKVRIDDEQAKRLGFDPSVNPTVLGCGDNACAYLPTADSQDVVKITRDFEDARAAYVLSQALGGQPAWSIPVRAIYDLGDKTYAILAARAEPIDEDLEDAFDDLFFETEKVPDWVGYYEAKAQEVPRGSVLQAALEAVNEAMHGFEALGLDWSDFHGGNWAMYRGHPVLIDFGLSDPLRHLPVQRI